MPENTSHEKIADKELTHVAVAIIQNSQGEILISLRARDTHQGGLWEFPGGKVEAGESVFDALRREIYEELNLLVINARPFKKIQYSYSELSVLLDVWWIEDYEGDALGAEGQEIKWQKLQQLKPQEFPAANKAIINSLLLPDKYMITGAFESQQDFISKLEAAVRNGLSLVQLRCKNMDEKDYLCLAEEAHKVCKKHNVRLLLNTHPDVFSKAHLFNKTRVDGLHLSSYYLHAVQSRPVNSHCLLSVSCHTDEDIEQAQKLQADIILLSAVKETKSHPGVKGIGWEKFRQMSELVGIPVYALGGMSEDDLQDARSSGAQGVAAISSFWSPVN